jgi:hypothetical protein
VETILWPGLPSGRRLVHLNLSVPSVRFVPALLSWVPYPMCLKGDFPPVIPLIVLCILFFFSPWKDSRGSLRNKKLFLANPVLWANTDLSPRGQQQFSSLQLCSPDSSNLDNYLLATPCGGPSGHSWVQGSFSQENVLLSKEKSYPIR